MAVMWPKVDSVARHIRLAAEHVANNAREEFLIVAEVELDPSMDTDLARLIESPLQAIFWTWFQAVTVGLAQLDDAHHVPTLIPEHEVTTRAGRKYRLDFAFSLQTPELYWIAQKVGLAADFLVAVELDGHEFHERTPEQVALRNERDRDLMAEGWKVLHFSGREIHRDPIKCALHALDAFRTEFDTWYVALVRRAVEFGYQPRHEDPLSFAQAMRRQKKP